MKLKPRAVPIVFVCSLSMVGCSSGGDHPAPGPDDTGNGGSDSHVGDIGDTGNDAHDSGAVADSNGTDSNGGDSNVDSTIDAMTDVVDAMDTTTPADTRDSAPDAPPPDAGPPTCDPTKDWTTASDIAIAGLSTTGADDFLGGVTPDELTLVWSTLSTTDFEVKVADRSDTTSAFGAPAVISGSFGFTRVAISADGLTLYAVDATQKTMQRLTRAARGDAFGSADTTGFSEIDALAFDGPAKLGDPTISADGNHLIVTVQGLSVGSNDLYESTWAGTAWGTAVKITGAWTGAQRPSGYSFDARTIFLTVLTPAGSMALRPAIGFPFDRVTGIGNHELAAPNAACSKLYFSRAVNPDGTDLDLFVTL
jgi:hypothetical protein